MAHSYWPASPCIIWSFWSTVDNIVNNSQYCEFLEAAMSNFADIFAQIIQKLGGRDAVQSLLGVGPSALSNYLRRAELPRDKMAIISTALHEKV